MTISTAFSPQLEQNASTAERTTRQGRAFIAEGGQNTQVLPCIAAYPRLTQQSRHIADLLALPGGVEIEFEPPKAQHLVRPPDLG